MRLKASLKIALTSFMEAAAYRAYFIFTIMSNLFYMVIVYFLWRAIFSSVSTATINGMTFKQTFIYLALAGCVSSVLMTWTEWGMSRDMKNGNISLYFIRPIDYQVNVFSKSLGDIWTNFIIIFIPSFLVVLLFAGDEIKIGYNLIIFVIAFAIAALINLMFDFLIGLISFYTESIWGISTMKDTVILLLAGAIIPLQFFPQNIRKVVEMLPFQAIYNLPLKILIEKSYTLEDYVMILLQQLFWLAVLFIITRLCFKKASTAITINGG